MTIETIAGMSVTLANVELRAERLNACDEVLKWLAIQDSVQSAWNTCERPDWLIRLAGRCKIDRKILVRIACDCARTSLRFVPTGEDRPRIAIETTERWIIGTATIDDVYHARAAAYAVACAADAADAVACAADAADAAACAADAADAAACAADAADAAAYATYATRKQVNIQMCAIIRTHITLDQIIEGMFN